MKLSFLATLISMALISTSGLANVLPSKRTPPLPSFKRQLNNGLPLGGLLRGSFPGSLLQASSGASPLGGISGISSIGGGLLGSGDSPPISIAGGLPAELLDLLPSSSSITGFSSPKIKRGGDHNNHDNDRIDLQYLNLALLLQEFLTAFFERGLSRYSEADFQRAGYPDWVRGRYEQIYEHEKKHEEFIKSAITSAGGQCVESCRFEFTDNDVHAFVDVSEALETIAASAYTGSLQYFNRREYITAGASILAVEARHAAWINSAVRKQNPWNTAFETPLTANEVATLLSSFSDFDSCPEPNRGLLPAGYGPYPRLYLSPRLVPGQQAELSFNERGRNGNNNGNNHDGDNNQLYAAFLTGLETIFVAIEERATNNEGGNNGVGNNGGQIGGQNGNNNEHNEGNNAQNSNNNGENRNNSGQSGNNNFGGNNFDNNNHEGNHGNNNSRYFVEIPRDLEARGTVFIVIIRGNGNIREINFEDANIVAGPAIVMFPFDSNGKPISW